MKLSGLRMKWLWHCLAGVVFCWLSIALKGEVSRSEVTLQAGLQQSIHLFAEGRYGEASQAFAQLDQVFGREPEYLKDSVQSVILPMKGYAALGIGQSEEAERHFSGYMSAYGKTRGTSQVRALVLFSLAQAQQMNGRYREAIASYSQFCSEYAATPESGIAHIRLAELFVLVDERESALAILDSLYESRQAHSLRQEGRLRALKIATEADDLERSAEYLLSTPWQIATMQEPAVLALSALTTGDQLFVAERFEEAVKAYRIVPEHSSLLEKQKEMLADTRFRVSRGQRTALVGESGIWDEYYRSLILRMEQMVAQLESGSDYTGALYLRRGQTYLAAGRFREAWVVFKELAESKDFPERVREEGHYRWLLAGQELKKWDACLRIATTFVALYPESPQAPLALFLMANAYQELRDYDKAIALLSQLMEGYEGHPFHGRWQFSRGFNYLLQEKNDAARRDFSAYIDRHQETALAINAAFWHALSWYFEKNYIQSLQELDALLYSTAKDHHLRGEIEYRRGTVLYALRDYEGALGQIEAYLQGFPDHASRHEAQVLKGDTLMGLGRLLEASVLFRHIGPEAKNLFSYAVFQAGKIFRALEEYDLMARHFRNYAEREDLDSYHRVSEALYWVGWAREMQGRSAEAIPAYEMALSRFGNDPDATEIQNILDGFRRLYQKMDTQTSHHAYPSFESWIHSASVEAMNAEQWTWYSRLMLYSAEKLDKQSGNISEYEIIGSLDQVVPIESMDAHGLARIGLGLLGTNRLRATDYFKELLERYPTSVERGSAYYGLGVKAYSTEDYAAAASWFHRLIHELPGHPLGVEASLSYARCKVHLSGGMEAVPMLEELLRMRHARGRPQAEALLLLGNIFEASERTSEAIAYYQRVYNMYRAYPDLVGIAYLRSASLFENSGNIEAAWRTYREVLYFTDLTGSDVQVIAESEFSRLKAMLPKDLVMDIPSGEDRHSPENQAETGGDA